jgi:hypothetical protein
MRKRLWTLGACAVAGLIAGIVALAFAIGNNPPLSAPWVALFSPGLRVAEWVMPGRHGTLGWTFSWFLRIAIAVNGAFYFAWFALITYWATRDSRISDQR